MAEAAAWGEGVDQLPVGERVTVPVEMLREIARGFDWAGPDDEPQPGLVQGLQVGHRQHPGVRDDHHLPELVAGLEVVDGGDDGLGFGLVSFPRADLQREPVPVGQQADDDLGIHPPLFGEADLAQFVLVFGLEIEGGHVVEHQGRTPLPGSMPVSRRRDLVAIPPPGDPTQTPVHRGPVHRRQTQVSQDSGTVQHRGRLHQTSQHELEERLVPDLVEPQRGPCRLDRIDQHC